MAVIKSTNKETLLKEAVVLDLGDLKHQADEMMRDAERRADEMLKQASDTAKKEFEASQEKGYAKGYQEGLEQGQKDGMAQGREAAMLESKAVIQEVVAFFHNVSQTLEMNQAALAQQAKETLFALSLRMTEKILHRELSYNREHTLESLMETAIETASGATHVQIRMCERDVAAIEDYMPEIKSRFSQLKQLSLKADPQLQPGDVLLDQDQGSVDVSVNQALDKIIGVMLPEQAAHQEHAQEQEQEQEQEPGHEQGQAQEQVDDQTQAEVQEPISSGQAETPPQNEPLRNELSQNETVVDQGQHGNVPPSDNTGNEPGGEASK